ncbi:MAG: hypothetical protein ABFC73_09325 [Clostridiaceae bacterium]
MKQQTLSQIEAKLGAVGVAVKADAHTDLLVEAELLDISFGSGKKKIRYEAAILADENERTVRMYEKTTELKTGCSFGFSGESGTQSGKMLFRKVLSLQYGPEGKAYEYTFEIGAIAKTVKRVAEQNGWKFRTVILKKKAMY